MPFSPIGCTAKSLIPIWLSFFTSVTNAATIIQDVRVFDGTQVIEKATIVVEKDLISQVIVGRQWDGPINEAETIDGRGYTLLPGLIDAHTHTFQRAFLERALDFGVTTSIDMGTIISTMQQLQEEQTAGPVYDRADILSAGMGATVPGGHGTQFGYEVPTLSEGDDIDAFVSERIGEGSEFLKLIMDDFSVVGFELPTLTEAQVGELIAAAHRHQIIAVIHARDEEGYLAAAQAGVDGFAHGLSESRPNKPLLAEMSENGPFVIPTLTTTEGTQGGPGGAAFAEDAVMAAQLTDREKTALKRVRFESPRVEFDFSIALDSVQAFHQNGTPILAGSDSPNPGTTPGASLHRELELLVEAGLTPPEALTAATANPANAFGLADRGRIAPGYRADLFLVEGDPTIRITDTRKIAGIWKSGVRHEFGPPESVSER
ncbi:MAG: amidohydrolase family protein [Kiloniellales bacterium]|nr:amidohydrolase family protein [Kiloniellales bacterium]